MVAEPAVTGSRIGFVLRIATAFDFFSFTFSWRSIQNWVR